MRMVSAIEDGRALVAFVAAVNGTTNVGKELGLPLRDMAHVLAHAAVRLHPDTGHLADVVLSKGDDARLQAVKMYLESALKASAA